MGHLPEREVCYMRRHIDFDKIGITDDVIFVCNFDLFAKNRSVYTFESICCEDTEIHLQDKRKTIFININGSREGVPEELTHLLDYLKTKTPTDGFTERLEQRVLEIRRDTEWRDDYMTLEMKMDEKYEQGLEEGLEQGYDKRLYEQIQKKLEKGKSISQIADECEESEDTIRKIISEKGIGK